MRLVEQFFSHSPGRSLYHYTGFGSLIGITKSRTLFASSIHFLNDAMELISACEGIKQILAPTLAFDMGSARGAFMSQFVSWLDSVRDDTSSHLFIFSLSEAPSQLSQWRSYTPHGKGVSIEFSARQISDMTANGAFKLGRCLYNQDDQFEVLTSLVDKLWTSQVNLRISPSADEFHPFYYWPFFNEHAQLIYQVLALIKHESFNEEREWRIISPLYNELDDADFREGKSMLVPYVPIPISEEGPLFTSVTLGPTPHRALSLMSLRAFLQNGNFCDAVDACTIPYREF